MNDQPETQTENGKSGKGKMIFLFLALAAIGAGYGVGWKFVSPIVVNDEPAEAAPAEEPGMMEVDAGNFMILVEEIDDIIVMTATVNVRDDRIPNLPEIRSRIYMMLSSVMEMSLVRERGVDLDAIETALMAMAPQEAPWIEGINFNLIDRPVTR